jgi:hypothetical protein
MDSGKNPPAFSGGNPLNNNQSGQRRLSQQGGGGPIGQPLSRSNQAIQYSSRGEFRNSTNDNSSVLPKSIISSSHRGSIAAASPRSPHNPVPPSSVTTNAKNYSHEAEVISFDLKIISGI